jgi:hypothetical protein
MRIVFEYQTEYGRFADALDFGGEEVPDEETIELMKQERLQNWLAVIEANSSVE